ncbi:acetate--CoA ligase family protein [Chloroflexota bacterium]
MELDYVFKPRSVAIIGASSNTKKWGGTIFRNIIDGGFKGPIYPVNPKGGEIMGLKVYPDILDIPSPVDLAVVGIPANRVVKVARNCAAKRVKALVVVTAGFAEIGGEGIERERELAQIAKDAGIRIVGPNCLGISNAEVNLNALPLPFTKGSMTLLAQSGNTTIDIEFLARRRGLGFNKIITFGNQTDIKFYEYMDYVAKDVDSKVVLLYIEAVKEGAFFLDAAKRLTCKKPVVAIKAGGSKTGSKSIRSHTAALATSDVIYDAVFRQSGIFRVSEPQDLIDVGQAMVSLPLLNGNSIAILTDGGGHAAMTCDAVEKFGLDVPTLKSETQAKLREILMPQSITSNPIDFAGAAEADLWNFVRCSEILLADNNIDGLLIVGALFGWYTASLSGQENLEIEVAHGLCDLAAKYRKPIIMHCPYPGDEVVSVRELNKGGIPVFSRVGTVAMCIAALSNYGSYLNKVKEAPTIITSNPKKLKRAKKIIDGVKETNRTILIEPEAIEILKAYDIPLPKAYLVKNCDEAVNAAHDIGYPVVAKIVSPDILHKSDAGCVIINLYNDNEVRAAYSTIISASKEYDSEAVVYGILISEMKPKGTEIIIGATRDPEFGSVVTFGLGGIFVEVLKDVAFGVLPLSKSEVSDMIHEIKGFSVLRGIRGEHPKDIEAVLDVILAVSKLMLEHHEIIEIDLNPVIVYQKGLSVVDARILLTK